MMEGQEKPVTRSRSEQSRQHYPAFFRIHGGIKIIHDLYSLLIIGIFVNRQPDILSFRNFPDPYAAVFIKDHSQHPVMIYKTVQRPFKRRFAYIPLYLKKHGLIVMRRIFHIRIFKHLHNGRGDDLFILSVVSLFRLFHSGTYSANIAALKNAGRIKTIALLP